MIRLDAALAERGLARSRSAAAALIAEARVRVDGATTLKASTKVGENNVLSIDGDSHYVSRAAHKLLSALDNFPVDPTGRVALDAGASTGGFTQVLRERGAREVFAVDVGHDQLAASVRADPGVRVFEGLNVRELQGQHLRHVSETDSLPSLVVGDLSFISLTLVLGALRDAAEPGADFLLLIKPQFEVGKSGIKEGIVRKPDLRAHAISTVLWHAWDLGLATAGLLPSPITGGSGNLEYLVWFRDRKNHDADPAANSGNPSEWESTVNRLAAEGKSTA
ncbi:TlyA family RNA methyltransferase [Mycetocola tolaasinivorans]|uniref:TlyA family RNA methyltransferase n=1 Tax=Mycetocola tolaasinivorans TaxID=76635 RepID=A0A3L6ZZE2_9MICO|nr:TlyA family RNA methyltransferase [Mycetocola tolaasinivorans]RLP73309.1 TlyA family RNA methyltransferase [Mycetocola tolaasinivorans]